MKRTWQPLEDTVVNVDRKVYLIVADVLDIDESKIHPFSRFREDLGADSLDIVMLIMAFSSAFEAQICDRDVLHIQTVGEAVAYLNQHLAVPLADCEEEKLLPHWPKD